jgi:hypothetical protein
MPSAGTHSHCLPCHLPALQPVRSFKVRGAYNKMSRLTPEQLARGVICSSAGNHAQVGLQGGTCTVWWHVEFGGAG